MIGQNSKQVMVKHGSNFVRVHICSIEKIKEVIFEDKSKKIISKELKNEKEINDTNVPDAIERLVSVVEDIGEAQDENSEVPIEISSEAEKVQEVVEEEEDGKKKKKIMKERKRKTKVIEQLILGKSEVIKKLISEGRNTVTSTVPKLKSCMMYKITSNND